MENTVDGPSVVGVAAALPLIVATPVIELIVTEDAFSTLTENQIVPSKGATPPGSPV